ncbi:MAG: hypothetical protein H6R13_1289 [Proteobacteria bacterium]|nr:hypothetical protein [Pseudomonadota bacterium]
MEAHIHSMANLFAQLGLSTVPADIDNFITERRPLNKGITIDCAPFWSEVQRRFLREEIIWDADWVGVINELNTRLSK